MDTLPEAFALKWNFGCGFNLICTDKKKLKQEDAVKTLSRWSRKKYHLGYSEMQYKGVPKKTACGKIPWHSRWRSAGGIISFIASTASRWRSCI